VKASVKEFADRNLFLSLATKQPLIPDPFLVARALGEGERRYELSKLFDFGEQTRRDAHRHRLGRSRRQAEDAADAPLLRSRRQGIQWQPTVSLWPVWNDCSVGTAVGRRCGGCD